MQEAPVSKDSGGGGIKQITPWFEWICKPAGSVFALDGEQNRDTSKLCGKNLLDVGEMFWKSYVGFKNLKLYGSYYVKEYKSWESVGYVWMGFFPMQKLSSDASCCEHMVWGLQYVSVFDRF